VNAAAALSPNELQQKREAMERARREYQYDNERLKSELQMKLDKLKPCVELLQYMRRTGREPNAAQAQQVSRLNDEIRKLQFEIDKNTKRLENLRAAERKDETMYKDAVYIDAMKMAARSQLAQAAAISVDHISDVVEDLENAVDEVQDISNELGRIDDAMNRQHSTEREAIADAQVSAAGGEGAFSVDSLLEEIGKTTYTAEGILAAQAGHGSFGALDDPFAAIRMEMAREAGGSAGPAPASTSTSASAALDMTRMLGALPPAPTAPPVDPYITARPPDRLSRLRGAVGAGVAAVPPIGQGATPLSRTPW
jgi:hypothetical protein